MSWFWFVMFLIAVTWGTFLHALNSIQAEELRHLRRHLHAQGTTTLRDLLAGGER